MTSNCHQVWTLKTQKEQCANGLSLLDSFLEHGWHELNSSSKKLVVVPGITTRNKKLLVTRAWLRTSSN